MVSAKNGVVRMAVPTRFMRDWVRKQLRRADSRLWHDEDDRVSNVEIVVQPPTAPDDEAGRRDGDGRPRKGAGGHAGTANRAPAGEGTYGAAHA